MIEITKNKIKKREEDQQKKNIDWLIIIAPFVIGLLILIIYEFKGKELIAIDPPSGSFLYKFSSAFYHSFFKSLSKALMFASFFYAIIKLIDIYR